MSKGKKIAFLFPGQGAQYPGMGRDFFEEFEEAREVFQKADALLQKPFSEWIFHGSAEELKETKVAQLAIFITSIAILRVVQAQFPGWQLHVCAGLSLGEYTALVAAGKISFEEALPLVQARGNFMQEACLTHPGTMVVVLGLELSTIKETIQSLEEEIWVANLNCPGQIVLAGTQKGIEKATPILKEKGARRILPLDVSGAFHSGLMQKAQQKLEPLIEKVPLQDSPVKVVMNVPGHFVDSLEDIRTHMIQQVTHPVYWQKGIEAMVDDGVELFVEIGPGKTLSGMNQRIGVQVPKMQFDKVERCYDAATS